MSQRTSVISGQNQVTVSMAQVRKSRFDSANEPERAGLTLTEEHEHRLEGLQRALAVGEASGPFEDFDIDSYIAASVA